MIFKNSFVCLGLLVSALSLPLAEARYSQTHGQPPRGPDIQVQAGNCSVGPFGQLGDVGNYSEFCGQLTTAEICFAFIKGHIELNGEIRSAYDTAKATFCANRLAVALTQAN